jgi:hypothetical protein
MDIQAYRVAVQLSVNDQISRVLYAVSRDALALHERFQQITKDLRDITKAANQATDALKKMAKAGQSPLSGATKQAKDYAGAMKSAAANTNAMASAVTSLQVITRNNNAVGPSSVREGEYIPMQNRGPAGYLGGRTFDGAAIPVGGALLGYAAGSSGGSIGFSGSGGGGGRGGGLIPLGGHPISGGGSGGFNTFNGWKNGVPPGGWGNGGNGSGNGGYNGFPRSGRDDAITNMATAYIGFRVMKGFVDEAAKYQTITEKFNQYGLGDAALKDAEKYAQATKVMGASNSDMLLYLTEAQGVFRESGASSLEDQLRGAKLAAPVMAKMNFAMTALDPHARAMAEAKQMDMLRFVEMAGGLKSAERFNDLMNAGFKAIQSSGGNVDFSQYRQFMARAGTSAQNLSDEALFARLEPIIGEMKGSTAGFANRTLYNRLNGIIKLPNQVVHDLMESGVWDASKVELNSMGGIKRFKGNPLVNAEMLSKEGATEFYKNVLLPTYQKRGLTEAEIQRENAMIGGSTGGMMLNLIDKQLKTIEHSEEAYKKARGLDPAASAVGGTYNGKVLDFEAKWKDFQLAMGKDGGLLDLATKFVLKLTDTLRTVTDFAKNNPNITKFATSSMAIVVGLAGVSGGMWILKHAADAIIKPLGLVGDGIKLLSTAKYLPALSTAIGGLPAVVLGAITAITAYAAYSVYDWYKNGKIDETFKQTTAEASKGGARFNPVANPNAAADYRSLINPTKYPAPAVPPKASQPVVLNVNSILDGKKVGEGTMKYWIKELTKQPSSTSGFDSTMLMLSPGATSNQFPR